MEQISISKAMDSRLAYGLDELARMIGVSRGFLRLEIKRGKLNPKHLGRRVVVTADEARRYLSADF